jgi:hypothetical protein
VRAVQEEIGRDIPLAGYYSFAECVLEAGTEDAVTMHNGSIALFAIAE